MREIVSMVEKERQARLINYGVSLGVADIKIVSPGEIPINNEFVKFCREPRCPGYGSSMSCPPNVNGPDWFRAELKKKHQVLVFKFDLPSEVLLSDERYGVSRLLHTTTAAIERFAEMNGYKGAKGYAAGSCKRLFCHAHDKCRVLTGAGKCRHPETARQSLSGFGVDFTVLTRRLGWEMEKITRETDPKAVSMGMLAGMVLLGGEKQ